MIYHAIWVVDKDPIDAAGYIIAGFNYVFPLTQTEYTGLFTSILARLFQSIAVVDYHISCFPENEYLRDNYDKKLKIFKLLTTIPENRVYKIWDEIIKKCNDMTIKP